MGGNGNTIVKSNYQPADVSISTNGGTSFSLINSTVRSTLNVPQGFEYSFSINFDGSAIYAVGNFTSGNTFAGGSTGAGVDGKIYVSTNSLASITQLGTLSNIADGAKGGIRGSQYGKYLLTFNTDKLYLTTQSSVTES